MASPCVVQFCKNIGNHRFPKSEIRRAEWIKAIKHIKPGLTIRKHSFLCSAHFKPTDYSKIIRAWPGERPPKVLKRTAIPSVFARSQASQPPEQSLQEQSLPQAFDPSKVLATYSKTPPIAYVEMPILAISTQMDEYKDPLLLSSSLEANNLSVPLQSRSIKKIECQEPETGVFAESEANNLSVPLQSISNQEIGYQKLETSVFAYSALPL